MIKLKFLILFILGGCCFKAAAQHCNSAYLGTKTLYKAPSKKVSVPPAGYKAVFINYVGRHGARHLTKDVSTYFGYQLINKADSMAMLTEDGVKLRQILLRLNKIEQHNTKSISVEGRDELKGLGERLYTNNQSVFAKPVKVNVSFTKEIRTKQSADAFLLGFKSKLRDSLVIKERNDDVNLRFYDLSPAYTNYEEKGAWLVPFDSLKKELRLEETEQRIAARWINAAFLQQLKYAETDKLINDVFSLENISHSVAQEAKEHGYKLEELNFNAVFTCDELTALGKIDNADGYYAKGPGISNDGIQVKIAAPLLADFISTTDSYLKSHPVNAELRFAHAETISPLATIMEIEQASKNAGKVANIDNEWKASEVIPLSANIQWIVYSNGKGGTLVKFLLNENEVKIMGMKPIKGNFYDWAMVRKYYLGKLTRLGVSLNTDMKRYLSGLK